MTKVKIPEPAAWLVYYPTLNGWEVYKNLKESEYMEDGAVVSIAVPLVIDAQAKSYANARVKQVLESLENFEERVLTEMERRFSLRGEEHQYERLPTDDTQLGVEFAIEQFRALMPKEEE